MDMKISKLINDLRKEFENEVYVKDTYETIYDTIVILEIEDINIYYKVNNDEITVYQDRYEWEFKDINLVISLINELLAS